jgi:hypothetical protein
MSGLSATRPDTTRHSVCVTPALPRFGQIRATIIFQPAHMPSRGGLDGIVISVEKATPGGRRVEIAPSGRRAFVRPPLAAWAGNAAPAETPIKVEVKYSELLDIVNALPALGRWHSRKTSARASEWPSPTAGRRKRRHTGRSRTSCSPQVDAATKGNASG